MKLGISLRLMGEASDPATVVACARAADEAGLDDLWVPDHIAIPPDDAEGSNGRYLDPLASLAHLAAVTRTIGLGTGVLVLPYRPALPTAKWVATIQELSGGRVRLGVGVGWMAPEFRALGLERRQRAEATDATLDLLRRCFDAPDDVVVEHGQRILFRPRPPAPPIYVGGSPPHALRRAVAYGDGWMPMGADADALAAPIAELHRLAAEAGRTTPEVVALGRLQGDDPARGADHLARLEAIGVTRFVTGGRYANEPEFRSQLDALLAVRARLQR